MPNRSSHTSKVGKFTRYYVSPAKCVAAKTTVGEALLPMSDRGCKTCRQRDGGKEKYFSRRAVRAFQYREGCRDPAQQDGWPFYPLGPDQAICRRHTNRSSDVDGQVAAMCNRGKEGGQQAGGRGVVLFGFVPQTRGAERAVSTLLDAMLLLASQCADLSRNGEGGGGER